MAVFGKYWEGQVSSQVEEVVRKAGFEQLVQWFESGPVQVRQEGSQAVQVVKSR